MIWILLLIIHWTLFLLLHPSELTSDSDPMGHWGEPWAKEGPGLPLEQKATW